MKITHFVLCTLALIGAAACAEDASDSGAPISGKTEPITNFSTSQDVLVNINYELSRSINIEIYDQNPLSLDALKNYVKNESIEPIAKGSTDGQGRLSTTLRIASMRSAIYVYTPDVCAPTLLSRALGSSLEVTLTAADRIDPAAAQAKSRAIADTDVYWTKWDKQTVTFRPNSAWSWNTVGTPSYLLEERFNIDSKMQTIIDNTIPKGEKLDKRFFTLSEIAISENANVKLYFVSNSSARKNALAYFTYSGNAPSQSDINNSLTVLFPNLSTEALRAGDGVELLYNNNGEWSRTFPAGSKIGFVLLVDAWEKNQVATTAHVMYSYKKYNSYSLPNLIMSDRPQMAAFSANGNFILTFEDLPWDESTTINSGDFSDDVFILLANPDSALPDVDDGVEDPDKPIGHEVTNKGVLAFEDLWPYKGDYDMNDIVLKYKSTAYITPDMYIDGIVSTWTFCNNGGQYVNGFGISYDFPASAVQSIKIQATNGVVAPGIESQAGAGYQLLLFNNAAEIPSGTEFKVQIKFNQNALDLIRDQKKATAPFNPFITARSKSDGLTDIPRKEVHLTNYKPTPFAISFNGAYGDDLSDPAKNLYYVAATGYPFAIDLAGIDEFKFPVEREYISDAYPRFNRWVESDRKEEKDWYVK